MGAIDRGCLRISVGGDLVWPQDVPGRASRMALVRDMSGKQRMKRSAPKKADKASHGEICELLRYWQDECAPHEVDVRAWPIELVRACMADLKTEWAIQREADRKSRWGYEPAKWLAHKGAIWLLQIETNRYNNFVKRQLSFGF